MPQETLEELFQNARKENKALLEQTRRTAKALARFEDELNARGIRLETYTSSHSQGHSE
jgi:hypothetical protein